MTNIFKKIVKVSGLISGIFIAAVCVLMILEVIMRNVFNSPIRGVSEICIFLYVAASYLGFSYAQQYRSHITVDLLYSRMKAEVQLIMDRVAYIINVILFAVFSYYNWGAFADSFAKREIYLAAIRMPVYVLRFAIALGATFMLLQLIVDTIESFKSKGNTSGNLENEEVRA